MSFEKPRFKERAYPICKSYTHEPDLALGYHEPPANQYRLFCKDCDKRGQEAIPQDELRKSEMDNATKLVAQKKGGK